ncbi:MAG TPA: copper chaperone PCu(A)C [Thauera sp.]|nr:copper chaperone PCu(A)C [Thauera sp.]
MKKLAIALTFALGSLPALADVTVADAWVRATVPQQMATGAFMRLTSDGSARLVAADSPVASVVEIHEMIMDGNIMKMNAVPGVDLPAGQVIELKPGGYHVMLMGLKQQVKDGDEVPVSIVVEGADGARQTIQLKAQARPLNASSGSQPMQHGNH